MKGVEIRDRKTTCERPMADDRILGIAGSTEGGGVQSPHANERPNRRIGAPGQPAKRGLPVSARFPGRAPVTLVAFRELSAPPAPAGEAHRMMSPAIPPLRAFVRSGDQAQLFHLPPLQKERSGRSPFPERALRRLHRFPTHRLRRQFAKLQFVELREATVTPETAFGGDVPHRLLSLAARQQCPPRFSKLHRPEVA